ncbi:branched-chain amino acid transport system substrate-binding protein [Enhydrobacter aerosaccus]|uniref:Branched-chain amino acid transport system substrate-binding protein n=1 Tax=Enhydrobacter aerosaccus TaxID=225324 RepID=A0A1T4MRK5_9HYPH|nr:ABC transporter substrate-binding protein [Enhydrobacter aerosaccus]SJZ69583.1 branched-chain amino acid transport system substrate-binding protein [Enhydrobacter aerosaccus]
MRVRLVNAVITLLAGVAAATSTSAQTPFRIGVVNDQSGVYQDVTGPGQAIAARMAVEDFGGKVLGRPIEVVVANDQNKPDIGATAVRRWFDAEGVSAVIGGGNSAVAAAILTVARERGRPFMIVGAGNPDFYGKLCTPYTTQWAYDTYSAAQSTGSYLSQGGGSWFFITTDYAFGHALERDTTAVVNASGGKVLGSVKVPLNTADWSSFLMQAQSSGAKTIGLAVAGADLINVVKQANEFGLTRGGQRLAAMIALATDVVALGPEASAGLIGSESFYWNANEATRAWSRRWMAQRPGKVPHMLIAYAYSATLHYLKAVQSVGSDDPKAVVARMKEMPVEDFNNHGVAIRADGRVMNPSLILRAHPPKDDPLDVMEVLATVPGDKLYRPIAGNGCTMAGG